MYVNLNRLFSIQFYSMNKHYIKCNYFTAIDASYYQATLLQLNTAVRNLFTALQ